MEIIIRKLDRKEYPFWAYLYDEAGNELDSGAGITLEAAVANLWSCVADKDDQGWALDALAWLIA